MHNVIVIGGGPAGMMAAGTAAAQGNAVTLLEKNERPGRKLYITGKGRCNLTNATDVEGLLARVNTNARFLYSAFNAFGSGDVRRFFEARGVAVKTERGRRVFPVSDRAEDVVDAMAAYLADNGVRIMSGCSALAVEADGEKLRGVRTRQGYIAADAVIVATGGLSYPATGSTGDGYRFAQALGHSVMETRPSLVPLVVREEWARMLAGLSLKNVRVTVRRCDAPRKPLYAETGEMLFTHDGVSGPVILSASRFVTDRLPEHLEIVIDLKPALSPEELDRRIQRDFLMFKNKDFVNALDGLLPQRLIETVILLSGVSPERKVHTITRAERLRLGGLLKELVVTPVDTAGYGEAIVTLGGVNVREINPSTLMSKKVRGLFFAGEVLDVDAMTGGYNLQIAFSTGYLAGLSASRVAM